MPAVPLIPSNKTLDGWTVVSKGSGHRRHGLLTGSSGHEPQEPQQPGCQVQDLRRDFDACWKRWQDTEYRKRLKQRLAGAGWGEGARYGREGRGGTEVTEAICLGLGTLSGKGQAAHRLKRLWQLTSFVELCQIFSGTEGTTCYPVDQKIALYAQDPAFNSVDEEFLRGCDFIILRKNEASARIGSSTLIYSAFIPWTIFFQETLHSRMPAIYVGPSYLQGLELAAKENSYTNRSRQGKMDHLNRDHDTLDESDASKAFEVLPRARQLQEGRTVVRLPGFDLHEHALHGLDIFLPKVDDED